MRPEITIVGGGLAGLVAAIACAEAGAPVRLREASRSLGGRARTLDGPFKANLGPHALYNDGAAWQWLRRRDLLPEIGCPPSGGFWVRHQGRIRRLPPDGVVRSLLHQGLEAPSDADFRTWARERMDTPTADALCGIACVFTVDADPGRLSAAFIWERLVRVMAAPTVARYPIGGWTALVDRLEHAARRLGVEITTGDRVTVLPEPPVIVATDLPAAAALLDDDTLRWTGGRALLLDLGLRRWRGDPFMVSDLDEGGWIERFTATDSSLAPPGHELVQAQIGMRPGESADDACTRLERFADAALAGWRERVVWRRRQVMNARSGALDLPGTTWRDRPAIDRGGGVFLCGDMVAAPGLLGEVSFASAADAGQRAVSWVAERAPEEAIRLIERVRALPYGRPSERTTRAITESRGTCSLKHLYLAEALAERHPELRPRLVHRVYRITPAEAEETFGPAAAAAVPEEGLHDVHRYMTIELGGRRVRIDATFPGPPWDGRSSMPLACGPGEDEVSEGDADERKRALERRYCDPVVREPFIAALTAADALARRADP